MGAVAEAFFDESQKRALSVAVRPTYRNPPWGKSTDRRFDVLDVMQSGLARVGCDAELQLASLDNPMGISLSISEHEVAIDELGPRDSL